MKTSELTGVFLDWAVTKAEGLSHDFEGPTSIWGCHGWATNWEMGGPIIEREGIHLTAYHQRWGAYAWPNHTGEPWPTDYEERMKRSKGKPASEMFFQHGPTPLVAAMRVYVASRLGPEVDIPEQLKEIA